METRKRATYSVSVQLTERLRRASDQTGIKQSTILEKALTEYLDKLGISNSHTKATALE